jgi:hypothetical protein
MPSRKADPRKDPTIPPDRALREVTNQLESLQKLRESTYD